MTNFLNNIDKCFFSKRDVSLFLEEGDTLSVLEKTKLIEPLAPKHKITAVVFDASKPLEIEDVIQSLFYEAEALIGFDIEKNLTKYSDEKKIFVVAELLKDTAVIIHHAKKMNLELMTQLQRLSLTLKRYTRSRFRLIFIGDLDLMDSIVGASLRLEYVKPYFININEEGVQEIRHAIDVEIKLERRGVERFLGNYIEAVKSRPRVKSLLSNI